ncbi:DUF2213 domain-containing protein [Phascolarctobacterium succinatutens]|uniref:DUF2213 domain-containing protein n=1 Tax=Phascolarctobacterium succinatutens TaxID=626940 RepID=UPI0023F6D171|nr:DUF2213 domain-containing protein [Phascolarctobacterium succinatutens]
MSKAYFGSRISDHIIKTPEGFLICKDVPIARTGTQQYRGCEFGGPVADGIYNVQRPEAEVFDRAAVASFEGKPVCDEHPEEDVTPDNYGRYMKGVCRDVRRGDGDLSNCLVADLVIYDADLINKIEAGKREISCGYDCLWNPTSDSSYDQLEIRGNHVAVVDRGRAGHKVAIRDTADDKKGGKKMSKSLIGRILRALARDESTTPEDMEAAAKLAGSSDAEPRPQPTPAPAPAAPATPAPAAVPQPENKPAAMDEATEARFKKIEDALEAISSKLNPAQPAAEPKKDALDALEEELQNKAPAAAPAPAGDEDDVIEPPEDINAQDAEPEEDVEGECAPNAKEARDAAMALIKNLKPAVAAIPNEAQRKRAADSLAILIKGSMQQDAQYGKLMQMRRRNAAKDSKPAVDDYALGREIAKKYNPHYKNR